MNKPDEEYYSQDNYYKRMHASTFKSMMFNGESETLAAMRGEYDMFPDKKALLVGNFLHSHFESPEAHAKFVEEHADEILAKTGKNKGKLKSDYVLAEKMIERIEKDPILMELLNAAPVREEVIQGNIFGVDWEGKLDAVNWEMGYFVDFKTVRTLKKSHGGLAGAEWVDAYGSYQDFFIGRGYHIQMAAYREMLRQMTGKDFEVYVIAVTKEDEPLAKLYKVSENTLDFGMSEIEKNQDHIVKLINGEVRPEQSETYSRFYRDKYRVDPEALEQL